MSNEADSSDDGDIRNDRSAGMQIYLFSFIHHVYVTIFLNIPNGADELAGVDNMESEEVHGNHGLALAATSKNGKHDCNEIIDAPYRLQKKNLLINYFHCVYNT